MSLYKEARIVAGKIFLHFDTPPPAVKVENLRFYIVSNLALTIAWMAHTAWLALFSLIGIYPLAIIQLFSILIYVVAINLNRRTHHMTSMTIALSEIVLHQIIASRFLGWDCGFQYYIPVVCIFPFLIPGGKIAWKWALLAMCIFGYLYIEFSIRKTEPLYHINTNLANFLDVANILVAFGLFAMWAIYLTLAVNRAQAIIDKERKEFAEAEQAAERAETQRQLDLKERDNEIYQLRNIELKKSYDDLKTAQMRLIQQEKMASLGQVTAGMAHEINNPINFVSGSITPLKRDIDDVLLLLRSYEEKFSDSSEINALRKNLDIDATLIEIPELISTIEGGATRTAEIVKGLRNFSRLDETAIKPADINEGILSTLTLLRSSFEERIQLHTELGELPEIVCNPGKLNQVFMNIINNAIQAIDDKGQLFIKSWRREGFIFISIKDTGIGMDEEIKAHIFDPFYTTKGPGKGVGLGLSIAFGIIEEHKGTIEVKSEPGKGSEFIISLPVQTVDAV